MARSLAKKTARLIIATIVLSEEIESPNLSIERTLGTSVA